jgi:hypothetical protein
MLLSRDLAQQAKQPVFYSPWIYPAYKYKVSQSNVASHFTPSQLLLTGILIMFIYGSIITFITEPTYLGIVFTSLAEVLFMTTYLYLRYTENQIRDEIEDFIDEKVVKEAWL